MYRIKSLRKVVVLCTLVTYSFTKSTPKTEPYTRKKIVIDAKKNESPTKSDVTQTPRITIWIHGTKSMSFISDFVHAVPYTGLKHINKLSSIYRIKSVIKSLAQAAPQRFPLEHFYAYGWSGKLCFKKRQLEAEKLYLTITALIAEYQKEYGTTPHITLITHSHGGNVALNLATITDKDPSLRVELILLACPVQHETKELVHSQLFERIYSFYSPADLMQIIDPQGLYTTKTNTTMHFELSERIFPSHASLRQIQLEINGEGVSHLGFILNQTIKALPMILDAVEEWEQDEPTQSGKERILDVAIPGWQSLSLSTKLGLQMKKAFRFK